MGNGKITEVFKRLKKEKQEVLFKAAAEEFAVQGYKNASMNSLAKTAGVSKGSIFQYFRSKETLFDYVLAAATARVKNYLREVRDDSAEYDFFSRLESLFLAGFHFIRNHPYLARIYFHLLQSGDSPFGTGKLKALHRKAHSFLEELVREGMKKGDIRPDIDVEKSVYLLNIVSNSLLRSYYIEFLAPGSDLYQADDAKLEEWVKATVDLMKHGLELKKEIVKGD